MNGHPSYERCDDCDEEYAEVDQKRVRQCPRCAALEDATYAAATESIGLNGDPWRFSRVAMRERLGVTGNEDV